MLTFMKKLIDPKTKQSTAFYALLGVAGWDVIQRGLNRWNLIALLALAVPGVIGAVAVAFSGKAPPDPDPPDPAV